MKQVVLLRHGESTWNRQNRFTGWTDVGLSRQGEEEARAAAYELMKANLSFDCAYTSLLKRAIRTLDMVLDKMDLDWIPVTKNWRLNEKHYGQLQGLNKTETAERFGEEQVQRWRRSYAVAPDALSEEDPRNPRFDPRYADIPSAELPLTESLQDTVARVVPYWQCVIEPAMMRSDRILIVAHGNSLRAIVKHLKQISEEQIAAFNLPTAVPYLFEFDDRLQLCNDYFLGDAAAIRCRMRSVADQGRAIHEKSRF